MNRYLSFIIFRPLFRCKALLLTTFLLSLIASVAVAQSEYIQAVDEYVPAPGQFVNDVMPAATADDTPATMAAKCTERLANNAGNMVTLGAYGGYITFHFDHPVVNIAGQSDFAIFGNAMVGGSEPGIVMVSQDTNGNGLPDDVWYELSGSADVDSVGKVVYGYQITYTRQGDTQDVAWTDNLGNSGVVPRNGYHKQEYFPLWLGNELTFTGTLLPPNGVNTKPKGQNWVLSSLSYGYVDNVPNKDEEGNNDIEGNGFNLDWAVEPVSRQPVSLTHADFFRVYTALNQVCGWLGETSTEVMGAEDLHLEASLEQTSAIRDARWLNDHSPLLEKCGVWRSLDGRQLAGKPTSPGIYLFKGKKIIINP